jgi:thiamine-monophosphate kinase
LAKDLPRLAGASGCGYVIEEGRIPCTPGSDVAAAMGDGEDFEILMAVEPGQVPGLLAAWSERFPGLPLSVIGRLVEEGRGDSLRGGWDHFSSSNSP